MILVNQNIGEAKIIDEPISLQIARETGEIVPFLRLYARLFHDPNEPLTNGKKPVYCHYFNANGKNWRQGILKRAEKQFGRGDIIPETIKYHFAGASGGGSVGAVKCPIIQ